jgi:hypothetical protein
MSAAALQQHLWIAYLAGLVLVAGALVYLGVQIRANIRAIQHNANITLRGQFVQIQMALAQDESLAEIYERGLSGLKSLSGGEQVRFFMIASAVFTYWNEVFSESQRGLLPAESWTGVQHIMADVLQYPGAQEYWTLRRHWYSAELQKLVDQMIGGADKVRPMYPDHPG